MVFQNQYPGTSTNMVEKTSGNGSKGNFGKTCFNCGQEGTSQGTGVVAQHADESVQNVISMVIMLVVAKEGKA